MKKRIIFTAIGIFFLYPIISLTQMMFAGSFDLYLLIISATYSAYALAIYFYLLWTVSSKHPVISWSIFVILIILLISHEFAREPDQFTSYIQEFEKIGLFRILFELLYLAVTFLVAFIQGWEIKENRKIAARVAQFIVISKK